MTDSTSTKQSRTEEKTEAAFRFIRITSFTLMILALLGWSVAWVRVTYLRPEHFQIGTYVLLWLALLSVGAVLGVLLVAGLFERNFSALREEFRSRSEQAAAALSRYAEVAERLIEQREFLRQVIDLNPNLIFAKDREGRFTLVNKTVAEAYGRSVDEVLGKTDADFNPQAKEVAHFRSDDLHVLDTGEELVIPEEILTDAAGRLHWLTTVKRPLRNKDGVPTQVLGVATDITARREMERELLIHKEHLEELVANRTRQLIESQQQLLQSERLATIGVLAGGIAHEINNPVGAILLAAQNTLDQLGTELDRTELESRIKRTCETMVRNASRCAQIVKSLLQFSRGQTTEKWRNDLNLVVRNALRHNRDAYRLRASDPVLDLAPNLPEIFLNPLEIEQVVINIVKNAFESRPNEVHVKVKTDRAPTGEVRIIIEDDGPGISIERKTRVFDPFFTTRQNQGGTGLGLSLAHGIVTGHGGHIDVESTLGVGTRITITFPSEAIAPGEEALAAGNER